MFLRKSQAFELASDEIAESGCLSVRIDRVGAAFDRQGC